MFTRSSEQQTEEPKEEEEEQSDDSDDDSHFEFARALANNLGVSEQGEKMVSYLKRVRAQAEQVRGAKKKRMRKGRERRSGIPLRWTSGRRRRRRRRSRGCA